MQKFPHTFDGFRRKSCIWQFTGNNIGVQLHKWCTTPFSKPGKGPFWRKRDTKESKGCPTFTFWCHLQDADISEPSFDVLIPAGANIFDVLYLLWLWLVSKSRWQIYREPGCDGQSTSVNPPQATLSPSPSLPAGKLTWRFLSPHSSSRAIFTQSKASFVNILICLAAYDTIFELLAFLMYALPQHSRYYEVTSLHQQKVL